jgi:predicted ATPase/DNA-binding CsgD family transcriptional regulator
MMTAAPGRSARHNLPAPLTSFIGREREVAEVQARLAAGRLLTLTGVGGCGKTRLALEVARVVLDQYPDGVWLVELGPLADAALVPHSVAAVVAVRETAGQSTINAVASRLRARRALLVLDNCEHLLEACAHLVDALLRACPEVHILATSREALGITGEVAWRVPSLPVPDPQHLPPLAALRANAAVRLFTERALATQSQFVLTERNAPAVAQVCARLDGIPLALELAAARVAGLAVDQLAARLGQRFRLLTGGSRTALPRQQTLRATLDWSYDLLSQPDQMLLERLSVFAGGWTLEAAEAVCSGDGIEMTDVTEGVLRLVNKSLVVAVEPPDGHQRYRLLETVRQYARERLVSAGAAEAAHERHAAYFLAFVEAENPEELLRAEALLNPEGVMLDRLEGELDNLRAALRWWIESQAAERALHQAAALFRIWYLRGSLTEGRAWVEEVLALPTVSDAPAFRVRALPMLAHLARRHGEHDFALAAFQELLAARRSAGDTHGAATTLLKMANVHYLRTAYAAGWACLEASRATAGDQWDARLESEWRFVGGQLALHEERHELARQLLTEELEAKGRHSDTLYSGYLFMNIGTVALEQGHCAEADELLRQGLRLAERYGDKSLLAHSLECLSGLASALGRRERALRLGSAAAALRESVGAPLSPAWQVLVQSWLEASRATLDAERARAAWQAGQAMTLEEAIAYAQVATEPPSGSESHRAARADPLTAREKEVAALIAQGLSNRQIAERLVITERTVAAHVEHILDKLAFTSRTQIGIWAAEHDLVASSRA